MKRFLKKFAKVAAISCIFAIGLGSVVSCDNGSGDDTNITDPNGNNGNNGNGDNNGGTSGGTLITTKPKEEVPADTRTQSATPTIYLAGDSTVMTYNESWFIGGWGQFLHLFVKDNITVKNAAKGGRSSRSFINEGRLFNHKSGEHAVTGYAYTFSENGGQSIEECIKAGDFLFVQFGHNDDDTKAGNWMADRMVPLGTPDANGIYPTIEPNTKQAKTYIQSEYDTNTTVYNNKADQLKEIAKYGDEYYAYKADGSWGTYKGFLKQYIKLARSKGATPVLVTPVARQSFDSNGKIKSGEGLHGPDFAYVKAVRQLAEEENCLLIDLFSETVKMQETIYVKGDKTSGENSYSTFLHAFAGASSSDLAGEWPKDYDAAYKNTDAGYNRLDTTHYNKYGAYLSAAKIIENILTSSATAANGEYFNFKDNILTTPSQFIAPPNRISKTMVGKLEDLFPYVTTLDPNLKYPSASEVVALITEKLGTSVATITAANLDEIKEKVAECRAKYNGLNFDDRSGVTNYEILTGTEAAIAAYIEANRPKPTEVYFYHFSGLTQEKITDTVSLTVPDSTSISVETQSGSASPKGGTVTIVGNNTANKEIVVTTGNVSFTYNNTQYSVSKYLSCGLWSQPRYFEITVKENARVTVFAKSSSASEDRGVNIAKGDYTTNLQSIDATGSQVNNISFDLTEAGTYRIGSGKSTVYFYGVVVEYYPAE